MNWNEKVAAAADEILEGLRNGEVVSATKEGMIGVVYSIDDKMVAAALDVPKLRSASRLFSKARPQEAAILLDAALEEAYINVAHSCAEDRARYLQENFGG